jgi:hypothetical protein
MTDIQAQYLVNELRNLVREMKQVNANLSEIAHEIKRK